MPFGVGPWIKDRKHRGRRAHMTVGGRKEKKFHLCMDVRIKAVSDMGDVRDRRQRRQGDYRTAISDKL